MKFAPSPDPSGKKFMKFATLIPEDANFCNSQVYDDGFRSCISMDSRTTRSRKAHMAQQQAENQSRAKWTASLTKTLADLMVEQIQKGNKSNRSFSKKGWKLICDNFRSQTGYWWDNDQLKSRYVALRKQYINVSTLLSYPDFQWDEANSAIIATDAAWDKYIREHHDAENLRIAGCPIYNQLRTIFAETGTGSKKQNGSSREPDNISSLNLSPIPTRQAAAEVEEQSPSESEKYADQYSRKRCRRGGIEDSLAKGILKMAGATKLHTEAINSLNSKFPVSDCVRALDELQGIDDRIYLAALDLFNSRNARETFLTLRAEKQLGWLERKCSTSTQ
ncbi:L10-interacting MYB domain-containing protein-like [Andrographis paniculata]|uniref:L10-interacting MYB domain-containing protein-like n=1 Tax=Andrographis paniculata TaxID=175694 RepID=UPI0021E78699|nr:L10-interacting MYB domain-containing protein-like [Andrographis paniculata]